MSKKRRSRGDGEVEQLPSGNWRAIHAVGIDPISRKRIRESKTFQSKSQALSWLRTRQSESSRVPIEAGAGQLTLAEWFVKWHSSRKDVVSTRTQIDDQWRWDRHVAPYLGSELIRKLSPSQIADWLARLGTAGYSGADRKASGALLRKVLYGAVSQGVLAASPMKTVRLPKAVRPEKRSLTATEVRAVIDAAGDRYRPLFLFWFDTGLRPGELFALRWRDVDLERGTVAISRALDDVSRTVKETKTKKGRRVLAISVQTQKALALIRPTEPNDEALVFPSPRTDGSWHASNFLRNVFGPTIRRAGVKCRPYDVRHTTATLLISAGVSIRVVSERLGHEDIQTTLTHYAHVLPGQQAAAAETIGDLITPR